MINDCCLILIIILFPPLGVFLMKGCGADILINLCLTILGYLPGHLHAFYIMIRERERSQHVAEHYSTPNQPVTYGTTTSGSAPPSYPQNTSGYAPPQPPPKTN
ncbi:hypothetical protein BDC45DRAFT_293315 [Circinella umbellata]|nr:hypothetical protein BDC45DRAFT_293315 [Circinella umbellata]